MKPNRDSRALRAIIDGPPQDCRESKRSVALHGVQVAELIRKYRSGISECPDHAQRQHRPLKASEDPALLVDRLWVLRRLAIPPLRRPSSATIVVHGYLLLCTASVAVHLRLHVGSVLNLLVGSADVAGDFVFRFEGERNYWDKAEGEPTPAASRQHARNPLAFTRGEILYHRFASLPLKLPQC